MSSISASNPEPDSVVSKTRQALKRCRISIPLAVLVVYVALAVVGPAIAPYDASELWVGPIAEGPSWEHPMGTDAFGRDQLSRVLEGTRLSMGVTAVVAVSATLIGMPLGLLAGFRRGSWDHLIGRVTDGVFAFPTLLLALTLAAILGTGVSTAVIALTIAYVPIITRFVRSAVIAETARPYVTAAHTLGFSKWRVLFNHVVPNIISPLLVLVTSVMALAVLAEAALSFLGVGAQPPAASWGRMLTENRAYLGTEPALVLFPGAAITGLVLSLNILGDALRDELDPRQRDL